jgi:hypothetical protein
MTTEKDKSSSNVVSMKKHVAAVERSVLPDRVEQPIGNPDLACNIPTYVAATMLCYLNRFPTLAPDALDDLQRAMAQSFYLPISKHITVKYRTLVTCRGITMDAALTQLNHDFMEGLKNGEDQIQPI